MADTVRPMRRSAAAKRGGGSRFDLMIVLDLSVFLSVVGVGVLALWLYPDLRERAYTALGYGWIPVVVWASAFVVALRYRPRWLLRYWNAWLAGVCAVVIAVGVLAFFDAEYGSLAFVSLGGRWGQQAVGESQLLGMLRILPFALAVPVLLFPRRASRAYWLGLAYTGKGLWIALASAARAIAYVAVALAQGIQRLFDKETRPGWVGSAANAPGRMIAALTRSSGKPGRGKTTPVEEASEDIGEAPTNCPQVAAAPVEPAVPLLSKSSKWRLPSMDLLGPAEIRSTDEKPLKQMAQNIENALADHGVSVEVADIKAGPRIVRFGLLPGWVQKRNAGKDGTDPGERSRVRVHSILAREKDLSLAMSTPNLRFEPVPGEALLGLEVPTPTPSKVTMREVMESPEFRKIAAKGGLPIALGADAGGDSVALDLAGLPHMMIAGATGSGKSVCINSIVASMMLTMPPDQLRMLMVDPKQVELTPFNGIPHLVLPVITDVDDVSPMLRGLIREMTRRYKAMADMGARNISGYNSKAKDPMPFLVLIVDELADLMLVGGFEIEQSLVRLAQLGRAAGIHLVLATQRPSVKVVTGLLKANIPTRVAFAVASQVDARVILDSVGAEKLLGKGDMLLVSNDTPKPRRVQGTLVLDDEVEKLVDYWLEQKGPPLPEINLEDDEEDGDSTYGLDENMVDRARELALRNPHLSSSVLERRLKIGGSKADQILEVLEDEGLLIPG
ncbi:MAG: hypothetical protein F4X65_06390 [Chloroflexi bacterium]|nr:hypothetical protein [Chloroflexota bacterium]